MTVQSVTLKSGPYNTDGVTKNFAATFQYLEDSDIVVTLLNTTTGMTTVGVLNTDYTVTDNVAPIIGGTVTIANNAFSGIASQTGIIAAGYTITLTPSIPQLQQQSYPNAGLFPSAAVEQGLDRLTLICQELQLGSNQALKTPVTDSSAISTTIPNATLRKNGGLGSYLFFSGVDGSPGVSGGLASVAISTAMLPVVQAASLGIASELLLYGNIAGLAPTFSDTNVLEQSTANVNSYAQDITQNTNSGAAASVDIVVANNLATATTFYGNFGMNSSGFAGSGAFNKASAVYLTATSGDLAIGTTTANPIHFVYNGGATDVAFIDGTGFNFVTSPFAPTPAIGDNSTKVATTAFAQNFIPLSGHIGLQGVWNSTTLATWNATALLLWNSSNQPKMLTAYSKQVNLATTGAGGCDVALSGFAANSWSYVWAIYNSTTLANSILVSASSTAPTMPSGYDYKVRIGSIYLDGSKTIRGFLQYGRKTQCMVGNNCANMPVLASGVVTQYTAVAVLPGMPPTATIGRFVQHMFNGHISILAPNANHGSQNTLPNQPPICFLGGGAGSVGVTAPIEMIVESPNIYWGSDDVNGYLFCFGYEDTYL